MTCAERIERELGKTGICAFVGLFSSGLQSLFSWSLFVAIGFILLYNSGRRHYYIYYGGLAGLIVIFLILGLK